MVSADDVSGGLLDLSSIIMSQLVFIPGALCQTPLDRVSSVECRASSVERRVSSVECRVSSVECRVSSVECRVSSVASFLCMRCEGVLEAAY